MLSDVERRQEVATRVQELDNALGRPPFANPCDPTTLLAADALHKSLAALQDTGKLGILETEATITTTLPILCASLPEGSADKKPCPQLYRRLLQCLTPVCLFSTFPVASILAAADSVLSSDDEVLFALTAAAHALTPARMRRFLGLDDATSTTPQPAKKGKGKQQGAPAKTPVATSPALSVPLVDTILRTSLDPPLVQLFLSMFNTPVAFTARVGSDGALAARLLDVYGALLLPQLSSAALIASLCGATFGYVVDVVTRESQEDRTGCLALLRSDKALDQVATQWSTSRTHELISALTTGSSNPASQKEAVGAVILYAFVLRAARRVGVDTPAMYSLCVTLLRAASDAVETLMQKGTPGSFVNATGDLQFIDDSIELLLEPLDEVVRCMNDACVDVACAPEETRRSRRAVHFGSCDAALGRQAELLSTRLRHYVETTTTKKPVSAPKAPAPTPSKAAKGNAKKSQNKGKDAGKTAVASNAPPTTMTGSATTVVCLLGDALTRLGQIFSVLSALATTSDATTPENLLGLFRGVEYMLKHQRRAPASATYGALLDLCAQWGWCESAAVRSDANAPLWLCVDQIVPDAVRVTSHCAWVGPFFRTPSSGDTLVLARTTIGLASAVLAAASVRREENDTAVTGTFPRQDARRAPLSNGAIAGLVGFHLSEEQLQDLAKSVCADTNANGASPSLLVFVRRQLELFVAGDDAESFLFVTSAAAARCGDCFFDEVGQQAVQGLQRLRDALSAATIEQSTSALERDQARAEEQKRLAQEQLAEAQRLALAKTQFDAARAARLQAKSDASERVRDAVRQRQQRHDEKLHAEKAARAHKRDQALATMKEMARESTEVREAQRKARVSVYQRRQMQAFRVVMFLEQLGLPSSRVLDVQRAVQPIVDTVTPDDLLEYLVTGKPHVPADMTLSEDTNDGVCAAPVRAPDVSAPTSAEGFWASVMNSASATAAGDGGVAGTTTAAETVASIRDRSFHFRATPFLDLFCYQGGDEFGTVPDPLPALKVALARRVVPVSDVKEMGFDSLDAVFSRLADRGLVTLQSGTAQLTLIGFRYHFPFHNEERMLEIRLQQNRERVRELLLSAQDGTDNETMASLLARDDDAAAGWSDAEEEEEEDEEDYQVLPDDEFSI